MDLQDDKPARFADDKPLDDYITGSDEDIAGSINDILERRLVDMGVDVKSLKDWSNAKIVEYGDVLKYYWGDVFLFETEPMCVTKGVRVSYGDDVRIKN